MSSTRRQHEFEDGSGGRKAARRSTMRNMAILASFFVLILSQVMWNLHSSGRVIGTALLQSTVESSSSPSSAEPRANVTVAIEKSSVEQPPRLAKPYEVCFVKSVYGPTVEECDRVEHPKNSVVDFQANNPTFRFFLFTNLPEIKAPGWTNIITHLPYRRTITHSRYGKFMAWVLPEIQSNCQTVFYMDGIYVPNTNGTLWKQAAAQIHASSSSAGLMQYKHPHGRRPLAEFQKVLKVQKDIQTNVDASIAWLKAQDDFDDSTTTLYENTWFGYDPSSTSFQAVATAFWERYSLEQDSWRDQPLWAYMLKKHGVVPTPVPKTDGQKFIFPRWALYRKVHHYSAKDDGNATAIINNNTLM